MKTQTKLSILAIILLLSGILFSITFAKRYIPTSTSEIFLAGTLEKRSDFNMVLTSGSSYQDSITIINNTDQNISYKVHPVDSEINDQNNIVFKMPYEQNPNLGQWVNFDKDIFEIPAHGNLNIPFFVNIPANAFPGTYYGGISILKITPDLISSAGQSVKVQTRIVKKMILNIPGEVSTDFEISNFTYSKDALHYSFKNKGNVIMTIAGEVQFSDSGLSKKTDNIKLFPLKVLPGDSLEQSIPFKKHPIFGNYHANFVGKIYYFDGVNSKDTELKNFKLETNFITYNIQFLIAVISLLLLLIIILVSRHLLKKKYISECSDYIVGDNENIRSIATKFNMNWKKLAKINHIGEPYSLEKGQKIIVHNVKK